MFSALHELSEPARSHDGLHSPMLESHMHEAVLAQASWLRVLHLPLHEPVVVMYSHDGLALQSCCLLAPV